CGVYDALTKLGEKMGKITLKQAQALAILELYQKLGLGVYSNPLEDALASHQDELLQKMKKDLIGRIDIIIDEMARDSLIDHVHSGYEAQIYDLRKKVDEQKGAHENELAELLERVEGYQ
ncbi:hypothetical protein, partial [Vibrio aestuarianus]